MHLNCHHIFQFGDFSLMSIFTGHDLCKPEDILQGVPNTYNSPNNELD
jgi:hypothetical protein